MTLFAPRVLGPVSICSKRVRIDGYIVGATVTVLVNGEAGTPTPTHRLHQSFEIGTKLAVGDRITARQEFDGDTSPDIPWNEAPPAVVVQGAPSSLSHLNIMTTLYHCGRAIWAEGAVPGAEVVALGDNTPIGSGEAIDGIARLTFWPPHFAQLALEQVSCNKLSLTTNCPPPNPLPDPPPALLQMPMLEGSLIECMTAAQVGHVVDGATVTLYREGDKAGSWIFDRPSLTVSGLKPFVAGERVEIEQSFACADRPDDVTQQSKRYVAVVSPVDALPKPRILKPVCPHPKFITITDMLPSARIILYQDGAQIAASEAPASTFDFPAPQLSPTAKLLTARMHLCGKDGPLSDEVVVEEDMLPMGFALDVSTMYSCAAYIFVGSNLKGKLVYVKDGKGAIISGYHQVFSKAHIPVSPALSRGDEITIVIVGCGDDVREFGPYPVAGGDPTPPQVVGPTAGDTVASVTSGMAGAMINVYVDGAFRGSGISRGDLEPTPISLAGILQLDQEVRANQSLCGETSSLSPPVIVLPKPPYIRP